MKFSITRFGPQQMQLKASERRKNKVVAGTKMNETDFVHSIVCIRHDAEPFRLVQFFRIALHTEILVLLKLRQMRKKGQLFHYQY